MVRLVYPMVTRNYFHAPVWVTRDAGFFEDEGLDVHFEFIEASSDAPAEMSRAGRAHVGTLGMEHIFADHDGGGHIVAIGGAMNGLPFSLIAQPGIRTIEDLRGKIIGVSSLNFGTSAILARHLAAHGLKPGDYEFLAMGPIEKRWEMLRSGEIDAGLQGAPMNFVAIDAGFHDLGSMRDTFPAFQFTTFFTDARWARDNREVVVRFLRAILRGLKLVHTDKQRVGEIVAPRSGLSRDYADRAWDIYVNECIFPIDAEPSIPGIQATIDMSAAVRGLPHRAATKPDDYLDLSYLREAQRLMAAQA